MRLVAQNARAHGDGAVHVPLLHKGIIAVAKRAQARRRIGAQHELEIALMRIVTADAIAVCDRLVDVVPRRQDVAYPAQFFFFRAQLKLMQLGFQLNVARGAFAFADGPVNGRFSLQVGVAAVIEAGLALHIDRRGILGGGARPNGQKTENDPQDSE